MERGEVKSVHVYEKVLSDICLSRPLNSDTLRVFFFLLGNIGKKNELPPQKEVVEAAGILQPNVSRACQELLANGYLIKGDTGYSIHPMIAFYGTEAQRDDTVARLLV